MRGNFARVPSVKRRRAVDKCVGHSPGGSRLRIGLYWFVDREHMNLASRTNCEALERIPLYGKAVL
jgi:hypothetical protein